MPSQASLWWHWHQHICIWKANPNPEDSRIALLQEKCRLRPQTLCKVLFSVSQCLECIVYSWNRGCGADHDKCKHPFFSYKEQEIRVGSMCGRLSLCLALSTERRGWTWGWAPLWFLQEWCWLVRKWQFICFCQNNEEDEGQPLRDALDEEHTFIGASQPYLFPLFCALTLFFGSH